MNAATENASKLHSLLKEIYKPDIMENIGSYSNKLSNAQVVKFFDRHSVLFTKTMIQNYIRVNLLPRPDDGRFYSKDHLYMLAIIAHLKFIYSIDELRELFLIIMKDTSSFDNMLISMKDAYVFFMEIYNCVYDELYNIDSVCNRNISVTVNNNVAELFLTSLEYMIRSVIYKQLALKLVLT